MFYWWDLIFGKTSFSFSTSIIIEWLVHLISWSDFKQFIIVLLISTIVPVVFFVFFNCFRTLFSVLFVMSCVWMSFVFAIVLVFLAYTMKEKKPPIRSEIWLHCKPVYTMHLFCNPFNGQLNWSRKTATYCNVYTCYPGVAHPAKALLLHSVLMNLI